MSEILNFYKENILKSKILKSLQLKNNNYFVISAHREENIETDKFQSLIELVIVFAKFINYL